MAPHYTRRAKTLLRLISSPLRIVITLPQTYFCETFNGIIPQNDNNYYATLTSSITTNGLKKRPRSTFIPLHTFAYMYNKHIRWKLYVQHKASFFSGALLIIVSSNVHCTYLPTSTLQPLINAVSSAAYTVGICLLLRKTAYSGYRFTSSRE